MIKTAATIATNRNITQKESSGTRNEYDLLHPLFDKYGHQHPFKFWGEVVHSNEYLGHLVTVHLKKPDPAIFDLALLLEVGALKLIRQFTLDLERIDFSDLEPQAIKYANSIERAKRFLKFGESLHTGTHSVPFIAKEEEVSDLLILRAFWKKDIKPQIEQDGIILGERRFPIIETILDLAPNYDS